MEFSKRSDYETLFIEDTPMIDVRAPMEYEQGSFPQVKNLPLINNEERHNIGICYKEMGQEKAIKLGHELVSGKTKDRRIADWETFVREQPDGVLYCFRGGMRSKISQQWIYEKTGILYPRVEGGYKAMRRFLLHQLETNTEAIQPIVLSGRTGTGKTILLQYLQHMVDLEKIYNHRGSVFGLHATPQPSQIDAENQLSITLLKFHHQNISRLVLEDESANIGSRSIPANLYSKLKNAPLIVLEASQKQRVDITFDEYIINSLKEYQEIQGNEQGFELWATHLEISIDKIQRRLGNQRHNELKNLMQTAIKAHRETNNTWQHKEWIRNLLVDYYDLMYDYQLGKKADRVQFRGNQQEVLHYLKNNHGVI